MRRWSSGTIRRCGARPIVVGGGVVLAASYEARTCGVRSAMGLGRALRLCPHAVVVPPRMAAYSEASEAVFAVFDRTTPLVEALSIDEAFLDVGGLRRIAGSPTEIAERLRATVHDEVGLPITVGVARTKFLAKVASGVGKPDGLLVVGPGRRARLPPSRSPSNVSGVWVPSPRPKLRRSGITTVGEVGSPGPADVGGVARARRRRTPPWRWHRTTIPAPCSRSAAPIGGRTACAGAATLRRDAELDRILAELIDRVTRRLRRSGRVGRTVTLRLRFGDFTRATRSHTLPHATAGRDAILAVARTLLEGARPRFAHDGLTLIGVSVAQLHDG